MKAQAPTQAAWTARRPEPEVRSRRDHEYGVVCYASVGGSGIVATELAKSLARRNHQVHLISTEPPFRLGDYEAGLAFHRVHTPTLPAVSRAAVPAVAGQPDRAALARVHARHRPRALRHSARDGRVPGQADSCGDAGRAGAENHHHAARHRHHAARRAIRRTRRRWRFPSSSPTASRRCPKA